MKGIVQLPDGRWRVKYDAPRRADGKRNRKTKILSGTKRDAERFMRARLSAKDRGEIEDGPMTVSALFEKCFDAWRPIRAATTLARYEELFRIQIEPELGRMRVAKVAPLDLERAYAKWRKSGRRDGGPLNEQTILHLHRLLHRVFSQAQKWRETSANVVQTIDTPKPKRSTVRALDVVEMRKLLERLRVSKYFAVFAFLAWSGARRGEACGLRWADVDLENGDLTIRRSIAQVNGGRLVEKGTKSGRERTFAISRDLVDLLRSHKAAQAKQRLAAGTKYRDGGFVFTELDGSIIAPEKLSSAFATLVKGYEVKGLHLHTFRHSNASMLGLAGVTLKPISERLGHSTIGITANLYSHVFKSQDRAAADALGDLLGERGEGAKGVRDGISEQSA